MKKFLRNKYALLFTIIVTIFFIIFLSYIGKPITTRESPLGILSFELTARQAEGEKILDAWQLQPNGIPAAIRQTQLDYLFIIAYTLLLCMLLFRAIGARTNTLPHLLVAGITMAIAAGLLDMVENVFILLALSNRMHYSSTGVSVPALTKVILLLSTIGLILYGFIRPASRRIKTTAYFPTGQGHADPGR